MRGQCVEGTVLEPCTFMWEGLVRQQELKIGVTCCKNVQKHQMLLSLQKGRLQLQLLILWFKLSPAVHKEQTKSGKGLAVTMGYYKPVLANSGHCSFSVEEKHLNSADAWPRLLLWTSGKTFHGKKIGLWSQKVLVSVYIWILIHMEILFLRLHWF